MISTRAVKVVALAHCCESVFVLSMKVWVTSALACLRAFEASSDSDNAKP